MVQFFRQFESHQIIDNSQNMETCGYKYEPLSDSKRQIRIFTLFPLSQGIELQGHLQVVNFDSDPTKLPPYETLSYVWGQNPVFDHVLYLDSAPFKISAHLANVLTHVRRSDTERDLWIDAVCIDQGDHVEQGRQVDMMGDIYRNCRRDLAWLEDPPGTPPSMRGEEEEAIRRAFANMEPREENRKYRKVGYRGFEAWLREMRDEREESNGDLDGDDEDGCSEEDSADETEDSADETEEGEEEEEIVQPREKGWWNLYDRYKVSSSANSSDIDSSDTDSPATDLPATDSPVAVEDGLAFIRELCKRRKTLGNFGSHGVPANIPAKLTAVFRTRLWTRIWIVQELSCAKHVLLLAGKQFLSWKKLSRFLARAHDGSVHHFPWGRGIVEGGLARVFFRAAEIDKQRDVLHGDGLRVDESGLLDVLARFCDRESGDPRDRVYGLLGLVPQQYRPRHLKADYSIPSARLFIEVTAEIIRQSQNLDILCQNPWERRGAPPCSRLGRRTEALPSWAVDFAAHELSWNVGESFRTREIMFAGDKARKIFSAGGDFRDDSWGFLDVDKKVLQLHGYLLGQVGPCQPQPPTELAEIGPGIWGPEVTEGTYRATGEPKLRALWRTFLTDCSGYPMKRLSDEQIDLFFSIFRGIVSGENTEKSWFNSDLEFYAYLKAEKMWQRIEQNWSFFVGEENLFIMARRHVREGDYIAVVEGAKVPLILQLIDRDGEEEHFEIVSPAYVHGFMDGEASILGSEGRLLRRTLLIV